MRYSLKTLLVAICVAGVLLGVIRWSPALATGAVGSAGAVGLFWKGRRSGRWRWLVAGGLILLGTPLVSFPLMDYEYRWFGTESLTFHVTDATTSKDVSGAQVAVLAEGTWEPEFAAQYGQTDANGIAQAHAPLRGIGIHSYAARNRRAIQFRGERVEVEAPGYEHLEVSLRDLVGLKTFDLPQSPIEIQLPPRKSAAELAPQDDLAALQGNWYVSYSNGRNFPHREEFNFKDRDVEYRRPGVSETASISIDPTAEPRVIRFRRVEGDESLPAIAIYRINGHRMEICFAKPGEETAPTEFADIAGNYIRLRRASTTIEKPLPIGKTSRFVE